MIRTRVGYAGGSTIDPTYQQIGDHSETVQIDYDPRVITYQQLLGVFWQAHDPVFPPYSRQYRSAIFYTTENQKQLAEKSKLETESRLGQTVFTDIEKLNQFYIAEDYHQKYYLRETPVLLQELAAIYPEAPQIMNSTAAARLNGYLAGYGTTETLQKELDNLGLSEAGQQQLVEITSTGLSPVCPLN